MKRPRKLLVCLSIVAVLFACLPATATNELEKAAATNDPIAAGVPGDTAPTAPAVEMPTLSSPGPAALEIAQMARLLKQREDELAIARQEVERLRDIVRRITDASRQERLTIYYNQGCVFRAVKDFKKAEESFLAALGINPLDAGIHYNLAIMYDDDLRDKKKARVHYEKFLALAPEDKDAAKAREWLAALDSLKLKEPELSK